MKIIMREEFKARFSFENVCKKGRGELCTLGIVNTNLAMRIRYRSGIGWYYRRLQMTRKKLTISERS